MYVLLSVLMFSSVKTQQSTYIWNQEHGKLFKDCNVNILAREKKKAVKLDIYVKLECL